VKAALDATRTSGEQVVALCPFVASYIERHPDYADLLAPR
jgi:predicted GNAT family acetyltransferase